MDFQEHYFNTDIFLSSKVPMKKCLAMYHAIRSTAYEANNAKRFDELLILRCPLGIASSNTNFFHSLLNGSNPKCFFTCSCPRFPIATALDGSWSNSLIAVDRPLLLLCAEFFIDSCFESTSTSIPASKTPLSSEII